MCWLNVGRDLVGHAFNKLPRWSARLVWLVMSCLFRFRSLVYWAPFKPGAGSSPLPRRGEGTIVWLSKHRRVVVWVRAGDNWLFFSHTKYSVADVARPSVFRTVYGRWSVRSQSIFVSHRCCSLGRSTKRSDVCRVKRGFARTLNGGSAPEVWRVPPPHVPVHPLRAPFVLRTFPP